MLVGAARAADVARLVEAVVASDTPLGGTAGPVRPHDLGPATYAQLARAAAFACGVERARLPLYAPGQGWRERSASPATRRGTSTRDDGRGLRAPAGGARRAARRRRRGVGAAQALRREAHLDAEAAALSTAEHVLFAAVGTAPRRRRVTATPRRATAVVRGRRDPVKDGDVLLRVARLHARRQYHGPGPLVAK